MRWRSRALAAGVLLVAAACRRSAPSGAVDASARSAAPVEVVAEETADAGSDADASADPSLASVEGKEAAPTAASPPGPLFGVARTSDLAGCVALAGRVSAPDVRTYFVDGDDLLALVNRSPTGKLSPDYAPSDLVDLASGQPRSPKECERMHCLRREAASALAELLAQMEKEGFPGRVQSAFRSYRNQCITFAVAANKSGFCKATEQSALPGHSQHQLGTTIDLFTEEWARNGAVFRSGFGCTPAGKWIREHSAEFGFVMSYPIHPDDVHPRQSCVTRWDIPVDINPRTGYRYEHWHLRYIGKENAARFEAARAASGTGTPDELTLEQWLRAEKGLVGAHAELPVCDRCNCGACGTVAPPGEHPCDRRGGAVHLDERGAPIAAASTPLIEKVEKGKARKGGQGKVVEVVLDVPEGLLTQPPIAGLDAAAYTESATFEALSPYPSTLPRAFRPLPDAWVVAIEPVPNETGTTWPYRAALTSSVHGRIYNRANVVLPARAGLQRIRVPIPSDVRAVKVTVLRGGAPQGNEHGLDLE